MPIVVKIFSRRCRPAFGIRSDSPKLTDFLVKLRPVYNGTFRISKLNIESHNLNYLY